MKIDYVSVMKRRLYIELVTFQKYYNTEINLYII